MVEFKKIKTKILEVSRPIFKLVRDLHVTLHCFKFEDEIQIISKVTVFTRNHTEDDADDGTKNNHSNDEVLIMKTLKVSTFLIPSDKILEVIKVYQADLNYLVNTNIYFVQELEKSKYS